MARVIPLTPPDVAPALAIENLCVRSAQRQILRDVRLDVAPRQVLGLIGPSGAGKTTLLKCLNRLIELDPTLRTSGEIRLHGTAIDQIDADDLRARIGMLFQQPVVFPKSIYQNVIFGIRHLGRIPRRQWPEVGERALREAALWDEVKDRLADPATRLSVGQQQRLCLARTLASEPEVLLMDEPTSALDPRSTQAIEELLLELKTRHTIVIITHNISQARRIADQLACVCTLEGVGELVACGPRDRVLDRPSSPLLADYLRHAAG